MKDLQLKKVWMIICMIFSLAAIGGGVYLLGYNPFISAPSEEFPKDDSQEEVPEEPPSDAAAFDITIHCAMWTSSTNYVLDAEVSGNNVGMDCFWYNGADGNQIDWGSGLSYTPIGGGHQTSGGGESDTYVGNVVYLRYSHGSFFNKRYMKVSKANSGSVLYGFGTSVETRPITASSTTYFIYGDRGFTTSETHAIDNCKTSLSGTYYMTYRKKYSITFMSQGAQHGIADMIAGIERGITSAVAPPSRAGYTFKGWSDTNGGTTARTRYSADEANGNKTVYAIWQKDPQLVINPNGGSYNNTSGVTSYTNKRGWRQSIAAPTRNGYTFRGWGANSSVEDAKISNMGRPLYNYTYFSSDSLPVRVYNNLDNGTVSLTRVSANIPRSPVHSSVAKVLRFKNTGDASPNLGGFTFFTQSYADAEFYTIIVAKMPQGCFLSWYSNSVGQNSLGVRNGWLTSNAGTGDWQTYVHYVKCWTSGYFSSTSFFAFASDDEGTPENPIVCDVAYAQVYDATGLGLNPDDYYSNLTGSMTYTFGDVNQTLYALWEPTKYTITFSDSGGDMESGFNGTLIGGAYFSDYNIEAQNSIYESQYGTSIKLPNMTRAGYKFLGWKPNSTVGSWDINSTYAPGTSLNQKYGNVSLVAMWQKDKYTFKVKGYLDQFDYENTRDYATFDVYISGSKVGTGVDAFTGSYTSGTTYELKNIQCAYEKKYLGVKANSSPIKGRITGETIVILSFRTMTWMDYAAESYDSGGGTLSSPYIIKSAPQLAKLAKDAASDSLSGQHFKLGANIDLSKHEWIPIGLDENGGRNGMDGFSGDFDGDMYIISNMTMQSVPLAYVGLFGSLNNSFVKNVFIENSSSTRSSDSGMICGHAENSTISNCIIRNCSINTGYNSGMLAGYIINTAISNCLIYNSQITASYNAGSIVGRVNEGCSITNIGGQNNSVAGYSPGVFGYVSDNAVKKGIYMHVTKNYQGNVTEIKQVYGNSSDFGDWSYINNLNNGYPILKTLFHLEGNQTSEEIYTYLTQELDFAA